MVKRLRGVLSGNGYQARTFRGSFMTAINFGGHNALRLASNLVLTRLLFPEAFGLMALVQVVLSGAAMFSDFGIRGSIIQNARGDDPVFLNTAWTLQILRGVLLGLAVFLLAQPMASFYDAPQMAELLSFAAVIPVIQGFNSTRMATAGRHIELGRLTVLALVTQTISIVVMIALAWWFQSVWSLIIGTAVGTVAQTVLSHVALSGKFRNRIGFEKAAAKDLFGFGKYVFMATLAGFFIQHGDRVVLGKYVTLEELAIYNIGFFLAMVPLMFARRLNDAVIFPLYSRRPPSESGENRRRINRARFLLTLGLMGGTALLALIGNAIVQFMYDPRYEGGGPILVLIATALLPQMITLSYERLPLAAGRSGRYAFMIISKALVTLMLTFFGVVYFGTLGVIAAPFFAWVLTYPVLVYIIRPFRGWDFWHDLVYAMLAAGLGAALLVFHWVTVEPLVIAALGR